MRRICVLAAMLALGVSSQADAHAWGNQLFFGVQFPDGNEPTIDGDSSDWDVVPDNPYLIGNDLFADMYYGTTTQGEIDISDMSIRSMWGWNENSQLIYAMAEVFDDIHVVDRDEPNAWWADDAWEVYLNPLHQERSEQTFGAEEGWSRYYIGISVPEAAGNIGDALPGFEWRDKPEDGVQWGVGWSFTGEEFGESTYTYELWMKPWDFVSLDGDLDSIEWTVLEEEKILGMSMAFDDDDIGGTERTNFWSTDDIGCCVGANDLWLSGLDDSIDWGDQMTAVQSDTWGRIKTQFNGQ